MIDRSTCFHVILYFTKILIVKKLHAYKISFINKSKRIDHTKVLNKEDQLFK